MKVHTDAVVALAKTTAPFAAKTFVSFATRDAAGALPKFPYLVVHPSDGVDRQARVSGPRVEQHPRFTFHVVGGSYDQLSAGVKLLKDKFFPRGRGHVFEIPGEKCFPLWWSSPVPVQVDTNPSQVLVYQVIELGWRTEPRP